MNSIPLESNMEWWWYKAKNNLLQYLTKDLYFNQELSILEIGPGLGNNLEYLSTIGNVEILETDRNFVEYLKKNHTKKFGTIFTHIDQVSKKYDLIIMLDVLEHIKDSKNFMKNVGTLLNQHGHIIIGVPAYKQLWSEHDEVLKHFRRYTWSSLERDCSDFDFEKKIGLNYLLLPVRYIQIKLSRKTSTVDDTGRFMNFLLYKISLAEVIFRKILIKPKFGISLYAVLKK